MYDEVDLQLVNLLQIDPRISWAHAEQILGLSATTLARRWARLTEEGLAWISTHPTLGGDMIAALVDVDCHADRLPQVIEQLCAHRMVVSVDECTGGRDLLLTVVAPDLRTLTPIVVDWIGSLDGVVGSRSALLTHVYADGSSWRVNALDRRQTRDAAAGLVPPNPGRRIAPIDAPLAEALARDGRASVASLAQVLEAPASTVHRRLHRLLAGRLVAIRCDVAPELSGWLLEWSWRTNVAPNHKPRVVEFLLSRPDLRFCASTSGSTNLNFSIRSHALDGLAAFESEVAQALPGLAPAETVIHLRDRKRVGRILDDQGKATDRLVVPVFAASPSESTLGTTHAGSA